MKAVVVLAIGLCLVSPAHAQAVHMAYRPIDGATMHRVFQAYTRVTVRDSVERSREFAELGGVRQTGLRGAANAPVVHLSYDSVRVRWREGGGSWHEVVSPDDSAWVQAQVDSLLTIRSVTSGGTAPGAAGMLTLVTGLAGLTLPAEAVRRGDSWTTTVQLESREGPTHLPVRGVVSVDSVIPRTRDTLVYLGVRGRVDPTMTREASGRRLTGTLTAQLIWSTGWNAFVSAVTHSRVEAGGGGGDGRGTIAVETTIRQQVR